MTEDRPARFSRWLWLPLLGLCAWLWFEQRHLVNEAAVFEVEAKRLTQKLAGLQSQQPQATTSGATGAVPASGSREARPKSRTEGRYIVFDWDALGDPGYDSVLVRRHRRYAMANYRAAIDSLDLPPAEKEQVKKLIAARWIAENDASAAAAQMSNQSPELRSLAVKAARNEIDQQLKAVLGEERQAALEAAYAESSWLSMNWALATAFWEAGVSLSEAQGKSLAHAARLAALETHGATMNPATSLLPKDEAVLRDAAAFLSPEQWAVLREESLLSGRYRTLMMQTEPMRRAKEAAR